MDLPAQASSTTSRSHQPFSLDESPRAINCVETLHYGELKQVAFLGANSLLYYMGLWQVDQEAISQTFNFSGGALNINKVMVPGRVSSSYSATATSVVAVEVYNVDANNVPTTLIGATTVVMNSYAQSIYQAVFTTPITVTGNYAITVRPTTANSVIDIITNDIMEGQPWDEDLCKFKSIDPSLYSFGEWISPQTYSTDFPGGIRNFDLCVAPIVSYSADATLSATPTTVCLGDEVQFTAAITPENGFSNRMMSYQSLLNHFNLATVDSTFAWNVNSAANTFLWGSASPVHTYTSAGAFNTHFYSLGGLYSNCIINMAGPTITVVDPASLVSQIQINASSLSVCEGGDNITLTATPAGGTFSGDFLTGSDFVTADATAGAYTLSYTVAIDVCEVTKDIEVVVHAIPTVTFGEVESLCIDDAIYTLSTGLPVGGVYSGEVVTDGTINPATAGLGLYTVTYTYSENGCEASAVQEIEVDECLNVGILDANLFSVYPNPASGNFNIDVKSSDLVEFTMMTLDGKTVINKTSLKTGINSISAGNLPLGMYIVQIQSGNSMQIMKITLN